MRSGKYKSRVLSGAMLFCVAAIGIFWTACEPVFDPLAENDSYSFSMNGVIDLSADTQWVRVMPIRDSLTYSAQKSNASVLLSSGGADIPLKDSVFAYYPSVKDVTYANNFWTSDSMVGGVEYNLSASAGSGDFASVTFSIPNDFPTPIVDFRPNNRSAYIELTGIDQLVVAETTYILRYIDATGQPQTSPPLTVNQFEAEAVPRYKSGDFTFRVSDIPYFAEQLGISENAIQIIYSELLIISGNDSWPRNQDIDDDLYVLSEEFYNVEGGLGTVSGIVSKRIPLESCYDSNNDLVACPTLPAINWEQRRYGE